MDIIKPIPPFKRFCGSLGAFPEAFSDAMTVYEALEWLYRYLSKELVPKTNEAIELTNQLKEYVEHYFDNLDVQEEINNKLDAMAESGQLEEIIAAYINASSILGFDTVADMQSAENLIDGSYAETLGYYAKNDRGGAIYKIREVTNQDTVDGKFLIALDDENLVAELIEAGRMYVTQYGIKNDGSVDVTSDLQYLITKGRAINLVDGEYLVEGTLSGSYMDISGESQHSVFNGGDTKHNVIDASHTTKTYLRNFACANATVKVYGYNGDGGAYSEHTISDDRDIFIENIWFDEPLEGSGSTYWKLYIKTPKPDDYTRYGHDGYACYPIEITNNGGYNALMINNICTDASGTAQSVSDNSAIGIIDKVVSGAPTILVDNKGGRDVLGFDNSNATYHATDSSRVFTVNPIGNIAIGCSPLYGAAEAPGSAEIKIRSQQPRIYFYNNETETQSTGQFMFRGLGGDRGFTFYTNGTLRGSFSNRGMLTNKIPFSEIQGWAKAELVEGLYVWDTTNHRPLWFDGTAWINTAGTAVYTPS